MSVVGVLFVLFGLGAVGSGVWHLRRALAVRRDGVRVDGVVAGRAASAMAGLFPMIEYQTPDGHRLRFTSWIHWPPFVLPLRKRVPVRYSASNKEIAAVDTPIGIWGQGVGSLVFGIVLIALAPFA